jgi:hypothetical protein
MSVIEEMLGEQLDRIIARTELRVEQWCIHARVSRPTEMKRGQRGANSD